MRESEKESILNVFLEIATESDHLVDKWRSGNKQILTKININGVSDVVTELDLQIEENAKKILHKSYPRINFVGEETFKGDYSVFNGDYFIMDPIDGTRPFINGSDEWSISLCVVSETEPMSGLLYLPDKKIMLTAIKGQGTKFNGSILSLGKDSNQEQYLGISPHQTLIHQKYMEKSLLKPVSISALTPKITAILREQVSAAIYYPEEGKSALLWDYAAANLLIREAGGVMKSLTGDIMPYNTNKIIHKDGWIAAKNNSLFEEIKNRVNIKL